MNVIQSVLSKNKAQQVPNHSYLRLLRKHITQNHLMYALRRKIPNVMCPSYVNSSRFNYTNRSIFIQMLHKYKTKSCTFAQFGFNNTYIF